MGLLHVEGVTPEAMSYNDCHKLELDPLVV